MDIETQLLEKYNKTIKKITKKLYIIAMKKGKEDGQWVKWHRKK